MKMETLKVVSSNIESFEYDKERKVLTVHYHKEHIRTSSYEYYGVMPDLWENLVDYNGSYGRFTRNTLKQYKYAKL